MISNGSQHHEKERLNKGSTQHSQEEILPKTLNLNEIKSLDLISSL